MREGFRLGQQRTAEATDPADQMRFPHFAILACLDEFGPSSQRETSERLRFDPSDLVAFVDWLEAAGFVERRRDERDRRRYALDLTPAGRRALRTRAHASDRANAALFGALTAKEREQLLGFLLRALRGLEQAGRRPDGREATYGVGASRGRPPPRKRNTASATGR
jgi:DNA-binding MarR family transcriptional regulator